MGAGARIDTAGRVRLGGGNRRRGQVSGLRQQAFGASVLGEFRRGGSETGGGVTRGGQASVGRGRVDRIGPDGGQGKRAEGRQACTGRNGTGA